MKKYRVTIPYIYEFYVDAKDKTDAITQVHESGEGKMVCALCEMTEVEEVKKED